MTASLNDLLVLEQLDTNLFRSRHHRENFRKTLFGGQVLGQALVAGANTVTDLQIHSLHAYFLRAGNSESPVIYDVENVRDGRTISSRRVVARQNGRPIFHLSASFHLPSKGFSHQLNNPKCEKQPEELLHALGSEPADEHISSDEKNTDVGKNPFVFVPVTDPLFMSKEKLAPHGLYWMKIVEPIDNNPVLHSAALAFASDFGLLATALMPHKATIFDKTVFAASIDHAMWFHSHSFNVNEWLLCQTQSPWANHSRGFSTGSIYSRTGELLASTAQEGLVRPLD